MNLPSDVRLWPFYPVPMPLDKDGRGPAKKIAVMRYEVWDRTCNSFGHFDSLPEAINLAMKLSLENPELPLEPDRVEDLEKAVKEAIADLEVAASDLHELENTLSGDFASYHRATGAILNLRSYLE